MLSETAKTADCLDDGNQEEIDSGPKFGAAEAPRLNT
jgi:hypothetical protein